MKFLVIAKPRIGTPIAPTSQMIRAAKEAVSDAIKRGDADCAYSFVGGGGVSIHNANSGEELNQRLASWPLALFVEFDVRVLADYGQSMDAVAQAFERQGR